MQYKQNIPYSISITANTVLIIGLGNPGKEYTMTRHNAGFMALDAFALANEFEPWQEQKKWQGSTTEKTMGNTRVILLKPNTFMNLSGESAQAIAHFYNIDIAHIVAIYDELSIPFGQIRSRVGGQSAGHNGVKSLIQHLGADFGRIRIGIKNDIAAKADASNFVLGKFTKVEQSYLSDIFTEVNGIITEYIYGNTLPSDTRSIMFDYAEE